MGAVESSALAINPTSHVAGGEDLIPLARLAPVPQFARYAGASGGYGERVTERGGLLPALLNVACE